MNTLVIGPHPDDELLGCGGTLLKRLSQGNVIGWLCITKIGVTSDWDKLKVERRNQEIAYVRNALHISPKNFFQFDFSPTSLDAIPKSSLVQSISDVFQDFQPNEVFVPFPGDIHSDHKVTFDAVSACTKSFRYPFVKSVYAYETISETDFGIDPTQLSFRPNYFVDISEYFYQKMSILKIYESEIGEFPFPRSVEVIHSLSQIRGCRIGTKAAESFMMLFQSD